MAGSAGYFTHPEETRSMRSEHFTRAALGAVLALVTAAGAVQAQGLTIPRPSPGASVKQTVGTTDLTVNYSRPGVKGRVIWGGLVPYDKPWRTGANEATQFICTDDITVEGQKLPAGTYAMVTIPTASQWTVVFSKQAKMWGAFAYDPKQDQLRVTTAPVADAPMERMQFSFDDPGNDAVTLNLRWEKLRVPLRITVDTNGKTLAAARAAIAAAKPDDWNTPYRAANWAVDAGVALDEAAQWARSASKVKQNFFTTGVLAKLAAKRGDTKSAVDMMKQAIAYGQADTTVVKEQIEGNRRLLEEWTAGK
jgi:hypothetical protein